MNFDRLEKLDVAPEQIISTPTNTLSENLTIAFDVSKYNGGSGSNSEAFNLIDIWGPIVEELNEGGADFENPAVLYDQQSLPTGPAFMAGNIFSSKIRYEKDVAEIYSYIQENQENLSPALKQITPEFINNAVQENVNSKNSELAELARTNPGALNTVARFVGAVGAGILDPVTAVTAPFGGWSKGASTLKQVLQSSIINAGAGAISEIEVAKWYNEIDIAYTYKDFVKNVSLNAVIGGSMPLAVRGAKLTAEQVQKGVNVLSTKIKTPLSAEDQAIIQALDNQADIENSNPLTAPDNNQALLEHQNRLETAERAAVNNVLPKMSVEPNSNISTSQLSDNLDGVLYTFDPNKISVDAKTFQFKEGGDEFGVSERLQGITFWDKYKAGVITVYEYADGTLTIADGHQRLGLAKRILSQDPSQDVKVIGYKLREVDGISPAEARVIAAMKNIAEGTGTSIDAAKVLRVDPGRLSELPPRSELVRQARDMMALSDAAFGAVVNNVIPAKYGAIVGRLIDDQELQTAAIEVLAKADPSNAFQAEAIVRQVQGAGSEQVKQISLFGEEIVTESFYVERAKVLDRAFKELRRDKAAFETLVRNSERLEAEGNILAKTANERKASTDAQTIALLQTLANRKGPLSDALNDAARTARETNSYVAPTSGFIDAIRGSIESGEFDRLSSGDVGRSVDGPAQITRSEIKEPSLDGFEEPTGIAAERQADQLAVDMFGADEIVTGSISDFSRLLDQNPTRAQIDNHPSVKEALDVISSKPETVKADGYGSNQWHNNRVYRINDEDVVSTDEAILRFERDAETFAFRELKKVVEPVLTNKELTIVLGAPASGKSTIANKLAVANRSAILDSDEIKKTLPEYENGVGASAVHEESSNLAKELQSVMIERGTNIVLPKVGIDVKTVRDVISLYRSKDYKVRIVHMDVTPENSIIRNYKRFVSDGRIVPPNYLDRVGSNPKSTYQTLKQEGVADGYAEIDNNGRINEPQTVTEISGDNPLSGSSLDVSAGRTTGPDAIQRADRESTEDFIQTEAIDSLDMDLEVPSGERINPDTGEIETTTITLRDLKKQMDQEDAMIKRLEFCTV